MFQGGFGPAPFQEDGMSGAVRGALDKLRKVAIRLRALADLLDAEAAALDGTAAKMDVVLDWGDLKVFRKRAFQQG
jgi:hypothetical protein